MTREGWSVAARKFTPSLHPRDRFGRFTRSRSARATSHELSQAAEAAKRLKPKRGITGVKAQAYLSSIAPAEHRNTVSSYTAGGYVEMHKALRAGKSSDGPVRAMDAAMIELPDDLVVSRRVPATQFGQLDVDELVGLKVRDAAFAPTSIGAVRATKRDVRLRIAVPAGTRAAVDPDTGEVILDRNLEMVVARVERNPGGNADVFLVVLPKSASGTTKPGTGDPVRAALMKLRVPELRARMRERGLRPGRLLKSQMVDALVADETGEPADSDPAGPSFDDRVSAALSGEPALASTPYSLTRADTHDLRGRGNGLPVASRLALADYRDAAFTPINRQLRTGEKVDPRTDQWIADIDKAMQASRLPSDVVTWRGLRTGGRTFGDRLNGDMTGMRWREEAYLSSSADKAVADDFLRTGGGVRMRLLVPSGTGAVQITGYTDAAGERDEAEILLQRGRELRVVTDRGFDPGGVRNLDVEVLTEGDADVDR